MQETFAANAYEIRALFPLADNDGRPFDRDVWGWWQDEMTNLEFAICIHAYRNRAGGLARSD
jgi:hypothetical protein